jgi:hypothetical protein
MYWYAAHLVMVVKQHRGQQRRFPAWESIVILRASSEELAFAKAEAIGHKAAEEDDGTFHWRGKPARFEFVGVRKIVECLLMGLVPGDTDEVTYNELEFSTLKAVQEFTRGKSVVVRYDDELRVLEQPDAPRKAKRRKART